MKSILVNGVVCLVAVALVGCEPEVIAVDEGPGVAAAAQAGPGPAGPGGSSSDTALIAVAFYISGGVGGPVSSRVFKGEYGVVSYGVDGGYVDFDDYLCSWYARTSSFGAASDCPDCEYSFVADFDTPEEDGDYCDALKDSLGDYGYTGPEVFVADMEIGFVKSGSASYGDLDYDYGYPAFYYGYPYYDWYTSPYYSAWSYSDSERTRVKHLEALNGYYGVIWEM